MSFSFGRTESNNWCGQSLINQERDMVLQWEKKAENNWKKFPNGKIWFDDFWWNGTRVMFHNPSLNDSTKEQNDVKTGYMRKNYGPWWWSSRQHPCLLLRRYEFESFQLLKCSAKKLIKRGQGWPIKNHMTIINNSAVTIPEAALWSNHNSSAIITNDNNRNQSCNVNSCICRGISNT